MPNKTSKKRVAAPELPSIPKDLIDRFVSPVGWVAVFLVTQHSINWPNCGLHLTLLRGAGISNKHLNMLITIGEVAR